MVKEELMGSARNWVLREAGCATIVDLGKLNDKEQYPSLIGLGSYGKSVAVEVIPCLEKYLKEWKAGKFLAPRKGVGKFRFICVPVDLISREELPKNWGLLYAGADGQITSPHNPYCPKRGNVWRNGFDDHGMDDLLRLVESHDHSFKNLQYKSLLH
ncbi:hypothetical protein [Rufibacter tibetensis]|uniref:Uncharacterized protein n=1 Tax=Rufibacter tibetensis TaxID=512763 RepID=A0A0P0C8P5_9BACT|nr:hypothetical protein [Rufibacter tibetensis]ALJ01693.1 hypothetical protein DC20_21825 [Rufibacter tibetensis]